MARTARSSGLPIWVPVVVLVAGLAGVTVPAAQVVSRLVRGAVDTFDAPVIETPTEVGLELDADRYLVFERTGTTLSPELVEVVELERGRPVPVRTCSCNETITKDERIYAATLTFDVVRDGRHGVRIRGPAGEVIVTKSIADTFGDVAPWLGWLALAGVVVAVGIALLVVSIVTRRRTTG